MGQMKSYPDIYLELLCELYCDIADCHSVPNRIQRIELGVIRARYREEGISFITKTLPRFGKALDSALSSNTTFSIPGLSTQNGAIPKFLGWLLKDVFNSAGQELPNSCPVAVKHYRQLVYFLYKLEIPSSKLQNRKVIADFEKTERDLLELPPEAYDSVLVNTATSFMTRVVCTFDPFRFKPKHGPGAVATGEDVLEKSIFKRIYQSLDKIFPFMEWFRFNLNHVADTYDRDELEELETPTAKVVLVPKDSRGPRLISCEPLEIQWIQNGLGTAFRQFLESSRYTGGFVNFTDQSINRRLAMESSLNNQWVTLDMKEASDRVSMKLVEKLFSGHPVFLDTLRASRSTHTKLPNGTVIALNKFAPMGSSLCFPVEALVFYVLAVSAIRLTGKSWAHARTSVYVYGDDIIVRKEDYASLLQQLPTVGLMFNSEKCCVGTSFRESCGCDAFKGVDVTPVRLRTLWSHHRTVASKVLPSYVALHNAMYGQGYFRVANQIRERVEVEFGALPFTNNYAVSSNGSYVALTKGTCWVCNESAQFRNTHLVKRLNRHLHLAEYLSWESVPRKRTTHHDSYPELLRRFSGGYGSHGGRYALVRRNRLKRTWTGA